MYIKTVGKTVFEISISNHKYLENQTGDRLVKVIGFLNDLKVYSYHCSMSSIQDFVSESETMLLYLCYLKSLLKMNIYV